MFHSLTLHSFFESMSNRMYLKDKYDRMEVLCCHTVLISHEKLVGRNYEWQANRCVNLIDDGKYVLAPTWFRNAVDMSKHKHICLRTWDTGIVCVTLFIYGLLVISRHLFAVILVNCRPDLFVVTVISIFFEAQICLIHITWSSVSQIQLTTILTQAATCDGSLLIDLTGGNAQLFNSII